MVHFCLFEKGATFRLATRQTNDDISANKHRKETHTFLQEENKIVTKNSTHTHTDLSLSVGEAISDWLFLLSQNDQFAYLAIYQLYSSMAEGHGGHDFKRISCIAM